MEWFNILMARLRALFRRESVLQDIEEELRVHVEMEMLRNHEKQTLSNFVWDPPISDPAFFSVDPPPGYIVDTKSLFADPPSGKKTPRS